MLEAIIKKLVRSESQRPQQKPQYASNVLGFSVLNQIIMETIPFKEFPKMPRLSREMIITEKIDGTNASIYITPDGQFFTGSRTRWITPQDDNYGFSKWAHTNKEELMQLGEGHHFGEWWGNGIQRGYGLQNGDKRFSLFNVARWELERPSCCDVVPVLHKGMFYTDAIESALAILKENGSVAAKGFMRPEGIVVFHVAAGIGFKKTIDKDEMPKSLIK